MKKITVLLFVFSFFFMISGYAQELSLSNGGGGTINPPVSDAVEVEVHYDGPNAGNAVGAADANFIIAARFTPTELGPYVGKAFTKVRVYVRDATVGNTGTLKIYSAGTANTPGPEIYSGVVATVAGAWNEFTLPTPILVPNADVWFGLQATAGPTGVQFWGGCDGGPNHPQGQYIYFNNAWNTLIGLNPALTFNWNIRAVVDTEIPVELTSFAAKSTGMDVMLDWTTASEVNNHGFEIQRNSGTGFTTVAFVQGNGTTTEVKNYAFIDKGLSAGNYSYRLKQLDYSGMFDFSDAVEVDVTGLTEFALIQNYPNPFNPSTMISFNLIADSKVSLKIFNLLGQEISTLVNQNLIAGLHEVNFDGVGLNSGVYFYQLEATGIDGQTFTSVKKMILTK